MNQNYGRKFLKLPLLCSASNRKFVKISDRNFDSSSTVRSNGPFFIYHSFSMYNGQALTYKTVMLHPSFGFL